MKCQQVVTFLVICLLVPLFSGCVEDEQQQQGSLQPEVVILFPLEDAVVSHLVMISGTATGGEENLVRVEVQVNKGEWEEAEGLYQWSYEWDAFNIDDGECTISVRAWDGELYSVVVSRTIEVKNPEVVESDVHRWAVFIAAANFPEDNDSKLGNGGLYLAEEMTEYFVEELGYATSNIFLLFDDGWIREDNGYGKPIEPLQQRPHEYNITYGAATKDSVVATLRHVISQSNQYRDSEVFLSVFNHGYGDLNNTLTGGKLFTSSWVFLWDDALRDKELGEILGPLKSTKACIIVDACFCGGFADKTIFDLPTLFMFRSGIPQKGRIVITGTSKFRPGYTSTLRGPVFSLLWFEGLRTGDADGFKSGWNDRGRPTLLGLRKNGVVSVEEAFYYAQYMLRTEEGFMKFQSMMPQMNDRYPYSGLFLSRREMELGDAS